MLPAVVVGIVQSVHNGKRLDCEFDVVGSRSCILHLKDLSTAILTLHIPLCNRCEMIEVPLSASLWGLVL